MWCTVFPFMLLCTCALQTHPSIIPKRNHILQVRPTDVWFDWGLNLHWHSSITQLTGTVRASYAERRIGWRLTCCGVFGTVQHQSSNCFTLCGRKNGEMADPKEAIVTETTIVGVTESGIIRKRSVKVSQYIIIFINKEESVCLSVSTPWMI